MGRISYAPVARFDLYEAADFYARNASPQVVDAFYEDVYKSVVSALTHPQIGETFRLDIRRIRCHTFPYYIYYRQLHDGIRVVAFEHQKRHPGRLLKRLR